ncbi:MAG: hypothetical protein AAGA43_03380 [Bacteroidota bacterium]
MVKKIIVGCFILICFLLLFSCGKKYELVELDKINPILKNHVDEIVGDFIELVPNNQMGTFQKKGYITPLVHRGINYQGIYSIAPSQIQRELGDDIRLKLVKVLNRELVYSFSYEVESSLVKDGSKKIMFDINKEFGLAKIYFFVKNNDQYETKKDWVNLFSNDIFLKK